MVKFALSCMVILALDSWSKVPTKFEEEATTMLPKTHSHPNN